MNSIRPLKFSQTYQNLLAYSLNEIVSSLKIMKKKNSGKSKSSNFIDDNIFSHHTYAQAPIQHPLYI